MNLEKSMVSTSQGKKGPPLSENFALGRTGKLAQHSSVQNPLTVEICVGEPVASHWENVQRGTWEIPALGEPYVHMVPSRTKLRGSSASDSWSMKLCHC